jgi:hypothetical protein
MIRLITVIGHGLQLLPQFIKHYQSYVDEIQIVCYNSDIYPNLAYDVNEIIKKYDNVIILKQVYHRIFDWERVTSLYNEAKLNHPNDWWVIADIDEFQLYPNDDLHKLISDCNDYGWELVRGGFIDRIGTHGQFAVFNQEESIWLQFPNMGFFRHPMSGACPNKICVAKGWVPITNGQHYALLDGHTTWKWQGWNHPLIAPTSTHSVQVHHFKWDSTSIDRIKKVADINQEYSYSNEYLQMYTSLEKTDFKIDISNDNYMFESDGIYPEFKRYQKWNILINKITSI